MNNEELFLDNAEKLVGEYISRNKKYIVFFDTYEDMHQDIMLELWAKRNQFNKKRSKYTTFVFLICVTCTLNKIRDANFQKNQCILTELPKDYQIEDTNSQSLEDIIDYEFYLNKMQPISQDVFENDLTYRKAGEKYNVSAQYINRIVRKDIDKIRNIISTIEEQSM